MVACGVQIGNQVFENINLLDLFEAGIDQSKDQQRGELSFIKVNDLGCKSRASKVDFDIFDFDLQNSHLQHTPSTMSLLDAPQAIVGSPEERHTGKYDPANLQKALEGLHQ